MSTKKEKKTEKNKNDVKEWHDDEYRLRQRNWEKNEENWIKKGIKKEETSRKNCEKNWIVDFLNFVPRTLMFVSLQFSLRVVSIWYAMKIVTSVQLGIHKLCMFNQVPEPIKVNRRYTMSEYINQLLLELFQWVRQLIQQDCSSCGLVNLEVGYTVSGPVAAVIVAAFCKSIFYLYVFVKLSRSLL